MKLFRSDGAGNVPGRVAKRLRELVRDFDTSQDEYVIKLRELCTNDPDMSRVPEGIERSFFIEIDVALDTAKEFKEPPDFSGAAGLWEANLDFEEEERRKAERASAHPVDSAILERSIKELDNTDGDVVYEACRKLQDMAKHASPALPKLINLLSHRDPAIRAAAADVIAVVGTGAVSAVAALQRARTAETEDWVRDSIARALKEIQL